MIQLYEAIISKCIVHFVGNKGNDDGIIIASDELSVNATTLEVMGDYFFRSFIEKEDYYAFAHQSNVKLNTVYSYISSIFDNRDCFIAESANIAKFLYEQSTHPKIKAGDLYIAYIQNCILDGCYTDAIGIFKSETKDKFLKLTATKQGFNIDSEIGTNIKKLDKGCLIFKKNSEQGYVVSVIDNTNKGTDAQYWIEDFLHIKQIKDNYSNTESILTLAKSFVTTELPKTGIISKTEQIGLLNKTMQYFKDHETFGLDNFTEEVISNPEFVESFHNFKINFESSHDFRIDREFPISESAIKKQQRSYKRAINLDKKIQIIINGNSDCVERGTDNRGKFYKIYYNNEE